MRKETRGRILKKGLLTFLSLLLVLCSFLDVTGNVFAADEYENIALNKPVIASKEMAGYEGQNIVDGSDKTMWQVDSIESKPTITIDLQKEEIINTINLNWASNFAFKYKLYTAKSNKVFAQVVYHEENTGGINEWEMQKNTVARYIKIELIEANTGNTNVGLNEVEVLQVKKTGPVNIALKKPAFSSGNEANLDRLGPKGAFDGDYTDVINGRWSSQNITLNPQWIYVDLEEEKTFESISVLWQDAYATNYELQWSNDTGETKSWTNILTVDSGDGEWDKHDFEAVTARFVRLYATQSNGVGKAKPISIWEIEIYEKVNNSLTVDEVAENFSIGTITDDMKEMPSFSFDNDNIIASLFCSETDMVVDDAGKINKPLVDKEVLVTYLIKDTRNGAEKEVRNQKIVIPGKQKVGQGDNKAPVTIPSIQEWKGSVGTYKLTNTSRIVVQSETLQKAADITKADIQDLFGYDLKIVNATPQKGDIVLTYVGADKTIGKQGYTMDIQDFITISSTTYQGVFYGTRSILQALTSSNDDFTINKGVARDYSNYEYRKFMLDVGRKYVPMSYLEDFVKYLSYYKFSDIQVHLNDTSYNGHARFRLESDIEGLTATDGYYTKDEYRDFQYYAEDYGIRVISEFDTPAHSAVFVDLFPELGFDPNHLDIRLNSPNKDKVYEFISNLFDEYLGGDNPVIVTDAFNVGLDEYNASYKEDMTQYTKFVMELVHDKYGKTPLAWASMGCLDSNQTKIPDYPVMDAWANYAVSLKSLFNQDYALINATNKYGYIVPGGNNGYPDFAKEEEIYNNLSAGKFRDKTNAGVDVAEGHPKIVGGSISLWNDRGIYNGISLTDVFARSKSIIPYYAQTYWYGKDESKEFSEFKANIRELEDGPNVNIRSTIESKSELVYDFDMENTSQSDSNLILKDNSGNNYDAKVINGGIINDSGNSKIELQGSGYIEMKHKALTWPNSILFDINIDKNNTKDIILFEETRPEEECDKKIDTKYNISKVYLKKIGDKYQLMFDREGYHYEHSFKFDVDKTYKVGITSDSKYSSLIVDGKIVSSINGPILTNSGSKWYDSASLEIPLQKVGKNLYGSLDNIKLFNRTLSLDEISEAQEIVSIQSLTTNKEVSVSSLDAPANGTQNGENAVDGDPASRWTSNRAAGYLLTESITIDLSDTYKVNRVEIDWEDACAKKYTVQVSTDGISWKTVSTITNGVKENRVITFDSVNAKFIKLEFTEKVSNKYGYSIYEIRAFENPNTSLLKEIAVAEEVLLNLKNVGMYEGQINKELYDAFSTRLETLKIIANQEDLITDEKLIEYKTEIKRTIKNLPNNIIKIDLEAINRNIKKIESLSKKDYGNTQYNLTQDELVKAKDLLIKPYTQKMVDDMNEILEASLIVLDANKLDRLAMDTLIENSSAFIEIDYTKLSWKEFKTAYDNAKLIQTKDDVEKDAFDTCYNNLKDTIKNLELIEENKLDYSKLEKEISVSKKLKEEDYTEKSWKPFSMSLIKAEVILKDSATTQQTIDSVIKELKEYRELLIKKPTIDIKPDGNIVIKDLENNITIIGKLSKDAQLQVKSLTKLELEELKEKISKINPKFLKTATLESVFDIELLLNNQKYIFDGTIKVIMKLDNSLKDKLVGIVNIDDQGKITKIKSITDGEYISFEVSHLSTYAIVTYNDKDDVGVGENGEVDIPKTADNTTAYLFTLCALGSLYVFLKKRKSKNSM